MRAMEIFKDFKFIVKLKYDSKKDLFKTRYLINFSQESSTVILTGFFCLFVLISREKKYSLYFTFYCPFLTRMELSAIVVGQLFSDIYRNTGNRIPQF